MDDVVIIGSSSLLAQYLYKKKLNIAAVADNFKFNQKFHEFTVISIEEVVKKFPDLTYIICVYHGSDVYKQLQDLGISKIFSFNEYCFKNEKLLPYYSLLSKSDFKQEYDKNLHSIEKVKQLLFDEKSRDIFNSLFKWFWDLGLAGGVGGPYLFNNSKESDRYIYFDPNVYKPIQNEHLIDCGAYNGDTLLACPYQLSKYDGFEPDPKNYQSLINNKLIDNNNFKAWNCAVGAYDGIIQFSNTGTVTSKIYSKNEEKSTKLIDVEQARIDSKIPDSGPTIIKMDLEGYELEALEGCKKLDITNAVFAICTYHKLSHLWEIPLMLNKLAKSHKLIFRSYGEDWFETIIYAVPESRIVN